MRKRHGLSRRGFIQAGAAAGTAALLTGAAAEEDKPVTAVRVGIVGVGNRGTHLLNTMLQLPDVAVLVDDVLPS